MLVGTDRGVIFEMSVEYDPLKNELRHHNFTRLIDLPGSTAIHGIQYELYSGIPSKYGVMVACVNTLYQFSGDAN